MSEKVIEKKRELQAEEANVKAQIKAIVNDQTLSKSKRMIKLYSLGLAIGDIATLMGTRYNFVYNVISNYCLTNGIAMGGKREGDSKKDQILALLAEGKTKKEVAAILKCNYNYVFNIEKERDLKNKMRAEIERELKKEMQKQASN